MGAFKLLGLELSKLTEKKGVLFSVLGVLLVPIIYVAILLSATWGPYDNLDNLPVAFVNKDAGASSGGSPINVGEDLVNELKQNPSLGWHFVTQEEADKGLKNQKYYMVVEIPEDFSQKVSTVLDANPEVPELRYIQNEGLNFMASQVTKSATEKLREQLGNKITATYTQTLFSRLGDISNGFASGADGSQKLYDGTTTLSDGTNQLLQSLTDKSGDIRKLADGATTAESGAGQLLSSIQGGNGGIQKLAAGSKEVVNGIGTLKAGSVKVLNGLKSAKTGSSSLVAGLESAKTGSSSLVAGLESAKTGSSSIVAGIDQLAPGSKQIAAGMTTVTETTKSLSTGAAQVTAGLNQYLAHPALANDPQFAALVKASTQISQGLAQFDQQVQPLKAGADKLAAGVTQLGTGSKQLDAGVTQLGTGSKQLAAGVTQLDAGSKQLDAGLAQLVTGQTAATAGIDTLKAGATQVANGNASISGSWTKIGTAVSSLKSGLSEISAGNQTVATGWDTMTLGVTSLNEGAIQLKSGSQELSTGLAGGASEVGGIQVSDANIAMFANPVTLNGEKVNDYKFYRDSTAPYIMSLALFVGILLLSFVMEFKRPVTTPGSAISWYVSKLMQLSLFAVAQALIVSIFTLVFIKLQVDSIPLFILFTIFVSLTFMSIVFFLVTLGGNIGRFVVLVFIVLQLSTTGSNLPIPMLPENLQALSKYLPLTYSNAGFKSIISLGDTGFMIMNMWFLLACLIACLVLTFVVFVFSFKRGSSRNDDRLTGATV